MQMYKKEHTTEEVYKDDCHSNKGPFLHGGGGYGGAAYSAQHSEQHYKEEKQHMQNDYSGHQQHSKYHMSSANKYSGGGGMSHGGGFGGGHHGGGYGGGHHGGHGFGGGHHPRPNRCEQKPIWNFKGASD